MIRGADVVVDVGAVLVEAREDVVVARVEGTVGLVSKSEVLVAEVRAPSGPGGGLSPLSVPPKMSAATNKAVTVTATVPASVQTRVLDLKNMMMARSGVDFEPISCTDRGTKAPHPPGHNGSWRFPRP